MEKVIKRCNNFSKDEVEVLVGLVENHKEVVENKQTDFLTSSEKNAEWLKIEATFNSMCGTGRTAKMLRNKWDSLKKTVKKEYAEHKQSLYKTGGGKAVEFKGNAISNRILAVISVGATGTLSKCDSDSVVEISNSVPLLLDDVLADSTIINDMEIEVVPGPSSWNSWNPQQLRQPKNRILQIQNTTSDIQSESNILAVDANGTPTIPHTPSSVTTSAKRKRHYKHESTQAKLQKQRSELIYDQLAKKKIEFIDFQMAILKEEAEKKEQRLAEKHSLEIKLLEKELINKNNVH